MAPKSGIANEHSDEFVFLSSVCEIMTLAYVNGIYSSTNLIFRQKVNKMIFAKNSFILNNTNFLYDISIVKGVLHKLEHFASRTIYIVRITVTL